MWLPIPIVKMGVYGFQELALGSEAKVKTTPADFYNCYRFPPVAGVICEYEYGMQLSKVHLKYSCRRKSKEQKSKGGSFLKS